MVLLQDEVPRSSTTCLSSSLEYARRSLREYVLEWQPTDAGTLERLQTALQELASSVNSTDVVVLVKPGGLCPFCNRAVDLMRQRRHEGETFSLAVADLLHDEREALLATLYAEREAFAARTATNQTELLTTATSRRTFEEDW